MVTWVDIFVLLVRGFLGKIVGTNVLMDVVAEIVLVEAVDVVQMVLAEFLLVFDMVVWGI